MLQDDGISPEVQIENTLKILAQSNGGGSILSPGREGAEGRPPVRGKRGTGSTVESRTNAITDANNDIGNSNGNGNGVGSKPATAVDRTVPKKGPVTGTTTARKYYFGNNKHQHQQDNRIGSDPGAVGDDTPGSSAGWKLFGGGSGNGRRRGRGNKKILPSELGFDESAGGGEAVTDPLMLPNQGLSTEMS